MGSCLALLVSIYLLFGRWTCDFVWLTTSGRFLLPLHVYIIFLANAGTEALFADLAHFPVSAVQIAFTTVVFPCLLAAYCGQAAYLMQNKDHVVDAFYHSIPGQLVHYDILLCSVWRTSND